MIDAAFDNLVHDLRLPVDHGHWAARLRSDPLFASEMRVCREWRIPHSEFLSWSALDREKAIAYVVHESARCTECGTHPQDWPTEDIEPFVVEGVRCFGCRATQEYMDRYRSAATLRNGEPDKAAMWGLRTRLVPKEQ